MTVAVEAGLTIQGYASLWGVADLNGDVTAKGAFADSLKRTGAGGVRMLHQHEGRAVVGVWDEIVEDDPGQQAVLDRLLDLLLIAVLRAWFAREDSDAPGWYAPTATQWSAGRCG